jgi:hypothetical protein
MMRISVNETRDGARFLVRVAPRASRTAVLGVLGEGAEAVLKIALEAPPVEGRANAALVEFLAELLEIPRSAIALAGGQHARNKTILVRGRSAAELAAALERALMKTV